MIVQGYRISYPKHRGPEPRPSASYPVYFICIHGVFPYANGTIIDTARDLKNVKNAVQTSTLRQDEVTGTRFTVRCETTRKQTECIE